MRIYCENYANKAKETKIFVDFEIFGSFRNKNMRQKLVAFDNQDVFVAVEDDDFLPYLGDVAG